MKKRDVYILKVDEIKSLVSGLISHGPGQTYEQMRRRAIQAMGKSDDIDEVFLDMYESMIKRARSIKVEDDEDKQRQIFYYTIAHMLRRLAHEINRVYLKLGKKRYSKRFIRLASYNPESPTINF